MLRHIKSCTEEGAHRQLGKNEWPTTLDELNAFIPILYARGRYGANNLELASLRSVVSGRPFFRNTTVRDRFKELTKFLRLDKKKQTKKKLHDLNTFKQINWVSFLKFGRNLLKIR
ncbi:uncharacterized protein TNCV_4431421 [Trichonephila clavipes]|nr:uncharacterized protein TNCV_4431421 [Trichonephila clavipes]